MRRIILMLILLVCVVPLVCYTFGQNKIQKSKDYWDVAHTMHFDIYYPAGQNDLGKVLTLLSEESYYYLKDRFKQPLQKRIPIIIYETHQGFQTTNIIYPMLSEGVGGFTESFRNRVVIPFDGSYKKFEEVLIHEMTHAYINDLSDFYFGNKLLRSMNLSLPFWLAEGLPEYNAIEGKNVQNNMYIIDMVLNDNLYPLTQIDGYYAYRLGESFLTFIGEQYGTEMVYRYFFELKMNNDLDAATQKIFSMKFHELELRWHNFLKRKYYPLLANYKVPYENANKLTKHNEEGTYFNYLPRFSPDGQKFVFYSDKKLRTSIYYGSSYGLSPNKLVVTAEKTGDMEEFHFMRNSLSWFPDGSKIAFPVKTSFGDRICIYNVVKKKKVNDIMIPEISTIFELDVSHDGKRIVFAGQKDAMTDIYIYDLITKQLTPITHDCYNDCQPKWSPDDSKIVFTSERALKPTKAKHVFDQLESNIYYYTLSDSSYTQVTFDPYDNYSPMWDKTGKEVLFISERDSVMNYHSIRLDEGTRAVITNTLCGVFEGDLSLNNEQLIYSCFFDGGWDVFTINCPLQNKTYLPYMSCKKVAFQDSFNTTFAIERYAMFGERERPQMLKQKRFSYGMEHDRDSSHVDSTAINTMKAYDKKPSDYDKKPTTTPYKPRFYLDQIWGGIAYASGYGTVGQLQMSVSDLMGNHGFALNIEMAGKIKDSNVIASYLYLPYRIDYGASAFHITDEVIYHYMSDDHYEKERETETGGYVLLRYPFDRFFRMDIENTLCNYEKRVDYWNEDKDVWEQISDKSAFIYAPQLNFIYDNAISSSTGPISGIKAIYWLKKSFSTHEFDYFTQFADIRGYYLLSKRYALAGRLILGHSQGDSPQEFGIKGNNGVRGLEEDVKGDHKVASSLELRFPFLDYFSMAFPLPMTLSQIRGGIFVDAGSTWFGNETFQGIKNGRLRDVKLGFGFGPRLDLYYAVARLDIAWNTDFINYSKPGYYFSFKQEF